MVMFRVMLFILYGQLTSKQIRLVFVALITLASCKATIVINHNGITFCDLIGSFATQTQANTNDGANRNMKKHKRMANRWAQCLSLEKKVYLQKEKL